MNGGDLLIVFDFCEDLAAFAALESLQLRKRPQLRSDTRKRHRFFGNLDRLAGRQQRSCCPITLDGKGLINYGCSRSGLRPRL